MLLYKLFKGNHVSLYVCVGGLRAVNAILVGRVLQVSILQLGVSANADTFFSPPACRGLPLLAAIVSLFTACCAKLLGNIQRRFQLYFFFPLFDPEILTDIGLLPILSIGSSHPGSVHSYLRCIHSYRWQTFEHFYIYFLTGLCGGSASGKTTVARKIIEALDVPWVVLLSMDSFYKVCV